MVTYQIDPRLLYRFLDDAAADLLRLYFRSGEFTGGRFERFAGGGDRPEVEHRFTADDIVAVSLLGVRVPGRPALALLEDRHDKFNSALGDVPNGVDLWDAPAEVVAPGSPADRLWHKLVGLDGINWVTAGKLLARKRPRLIPVYDRVVRAALARPQDNDEWWQPLRATLIDNPDIIARLGHLRDKAGVGHEVSLLRVLDVSVWMRGSGEPEPAPDAET